MEVETKGKEIGHVIIQLPLTKSGQFDSKNKIGTRFRDDYETIPSFAVEVYFGEIGVYVPLNQYKELRAKYYKFISD
ncbi:MAG: hypothetical protein Q9M91_08765 [Candidatus Dojkabacteria bacterium]|nr:hypothetical protein [Candidatus Dojkabacteria bacterium]MDQ7021864.1 hypothetical protein [Candidatus Dojkabacteria bacterium]